MLSKLSDIKKLIKKKTLALLLAFTPVIISTINLLRPKTQNPKVKRSLSTVVIPSIIYVIITLNDDHTLSDIFLKPVPRCLGMSVHPVV